MAVGWWITLLIVTVVTFTQQGASLGTWPAVPQVNCQLILQGAKFSTATITCDGNVSLKLDEQLVGRVKASPGVNLTQISVAEAFTTAYLIHIFDQNIVFVDSVLDGLEPGPAIDAGVLNIANSSVTFVRLTVRSCMLSGRFSSVLNLGGQYHGRHEALTVQDSLFIQNRGNSTLGADGFLIKQSGGRLLISNTDFIGNTANMGGQVYSQSAGLAIDTCTFRNNSGGTSGCVYIFSAATAEVVDSSFESNIVAAGFGGALQVATWSSMKVQRSRFVNSSVVGQGGVAYVIDQSVVNVSDTVVMGNNATDGGAFYVDSSTLNLRNCTISGNSATQTGGAVYSMSSNVTAKSTTMQGNRANFGGGWISSNDNLMLAACSFVANDARLGGALYMPSCCKKCSTNATSTTFVDNTALMSGGAISSIRGCNTILTGCTFTHNSVTIAGGSGGVLHLGADNIVAATATWFEGNNATFGGAISSTCANKVSLLNSQFVSNAATDVGGALHFADGSLDVCGHNDISSSLAVALCSFQRNTASRGGGAAYIANGAGLNSSSSEFVHNYVVAGKGGAVLLGTNSSCMCSNTSFRGNQALQGGAVAVTQSARARFYGSCVFSSNAGVEGGALLVDGAGVVLQDSTLQNNTAQYGGGVQARGVAELTLGPVVHMVGNAAEYFGGALLVDFECLQQVDLPAHSLLVSDVLPTQARCSTTRLDISSSTEFAGNTAGGAGPNIYAAASLTDVPLQLASTFSGPLGQWVSGPVAEVVVQGKGLEAYVSSDDVYLDLKVHVLDAWKQPVTVDPTTMQPVQVTLNLNQNGAAGALLLGQTQAPAIGGTAVLQKATLRAMPGEYQLIVTSLNAPLANLTVVRVIVRPCQAGELNITGRLVCQRCSAGQYSLDPTDTPCNSCPAHATCPGGAALLPQEGYWQSSPRSTEFHKCLQPNACRGISNEALQCSAAEETPCDQPPNATQYQALQCREGYSGNLCGKCRVDGEVQYGHMLRFTCSRCRSKTVAAVAMVMLAVVVCAALLLLVIINMVRDSEAPVHAGDFIKVLIRHFQHLLLLSYLDVRWHATFSWLHTASRWLFDATGSGVASVDCLLSTGGLLLPRSFASKLIAVLLPLGMLLPVIGAAMYMRHRVWNKIRLREHFTAGSWWQSQQSVTPFNTLMVAVVTGLSFYYCSLANHILRVFYCLRLDSDPGSSVNWRHGYWAEDLDAECYQGWHLTLVLVLGVPGVLLVCIGIPATLVLLLFRSRMQRHPAAPVYKFGFLLACYRPELWYWEAARQLQLLAAVALVVFTPLLPLAAQAALLLLLFATITCSHVVVLPFKDALINKLEFAVLMTSMVNISGVLVISGGVTGGDGSARSLIMGLAVLSINVTLVACIVYSAFRTQLMHVRHLLTKKWMDLAVCGQKLIERCRLGCKCLSSSGPPT